MKEAIKNDERQTVGHDESPSENAENVQKHRKKLRGDDDIRVSIKRKVYDTATSDEISRSGDEVLYRKPQTGEYFLRSGDSIQPMTQQGAKNWLLQFMSHTLADKLLIGNKSEFGASLSLRNARERACLSQYDLARKAEVALGTIRNYEQGRYDIKKAPASILAMLSKALGTSIEELIK